ncbi:hypothetical protein OS493_023397 [Desmophyllum pertusum]|uniref:Uncharacterized protein n=1 Tax=Desmophyllum pertusum TaxID=174260 RepID=A0A9X0A0C5_9CNID|nr:hypothetical protein OS493_023397 [Desmophyllum pertusum]
MDYIVIILRLVAPTTPGADGEVTRTGYIQRLKLSNSAKSKYPLVLLKLMKRYADDLIWANKIEEGARVLRFIIGLTENRMEASALRKVAKRRLGFLNKEGFDRFGRNRLFSPPIRWDALKKQVEAIRDYAKSYEEAYNAVQEALEQKDDLKKVLAALPETTIKQVRAQTVRLVEARRIAVSEKGAYARSIGELEVRMKSSLEELAAQLPDVYEKSQFNKQDMIVILQGATGFAGGIVGQNPFDSIGAALDVVGNFATKCNTGSLQSILGKIEKWLTFGKEYQALKDSSDLDFDKMDIGSVPEVMKANLEMNKEALAADLVCMLDERSLPRDKAKFEQQIENFFIDGAARIDLIAKIIDLDNDIGGLNFDIPNLEETANDIESLRKSPDSPITARIQQTFLDDLLAAYEHMETRFSQYLYLCYKGFEFRSLWNVEDNWPNTSDYQVAPQKALESFKELLS